jgi:hypothetical protein
MHTATLLGLLAPEDEGNITLRNIRQYSPTGAASHPTGIFSNSSVKASNLTQNIPLSLTMMCIIVHFSRSTRAIQKLKIHNKWEGKGNHHSEGGNTVVSSILPFPFVFAFTGTPGWPEVS